MKAQKTGITAVVSQKRHSTPANTYAKIFKTSVTFGLGKNCNKIIGVVSGGWGEQESLAFKAKAWPPPLTFALVISLPTL